MAAHGSIAIHESRGASDLQGLALGAAAGFAWIGALRAWMALLAGSESKVTWRTGPFVLLPGTVVGAAHGLAASRRSRGEPVPLAARWSPLAFAAPLLLPGAVRELVTTGIGSGALVPPIVMAVSGSALRPSLVAGRPRARRAAAAVGALAVVGGAVGGAMTRTLGRARRGALIGFLGTGLIVLAGAAAPLAYDGDASGGLTPRRGGARRRER
ncbi:hypothetical protein [Agrococcus sp. Marseille-Q4369]|uniref:hypothetical protein n=1 Tax=Agrococcus sp. Marseille-Q4369 TaxID=2810513 RepID=UPI001B8BEBD1|nr:hypothetical protein [Agrococcus sp. Marseille-Q4369]QUW18443.1 hypothetical protein JSQ78_11605 [Agrococcus sp. Marseille-Q4369]